jgi:hypothetical protein
MFGFQKLDVYRSHPPVTRHSYVPGLPAADGRPFPVAEASKMSGHGHGHGHVDDRDHSSLAGSARDFALG